MESAEALLLNYYPLASTVWSYVHPRELFSGLKAGATFTEFAVDPQVLLLRSDNGLPDTIINVFDLSGNKIYTIERISSLKTTWTVYNATNREQVAQVHCGLLHRSVSFLQKPGLQTREIGQSRWHYGSLPGHKFYLNDGAPYEWTRDSQYLERVVNPGGGLEEVRQRLARVRLIRSKRFDYELLIDPTFDREVALTTAFISMLTKWTTRKSVVPGARSATLG